MNKRAVLVLGPEASGTRLMTRAVLKAGYAGNDGHVQYLDWQTPDADGETERIVWRRSLPHKKIWPDLGQMIRELRRQDYAVHAVLTDRADGPMEIAQARDHVKTRRQAASNIARARTILSALDDPQGPAMPILRIQYEKLVRDAEQVMDALLKFIDGDPLRAATIARELKIYNANSQYVKETSC